MWSPNYLLNCLYHFIYISRLNNKYISEVLNKFSKFYSALLMLSKDYYKNFMSFYQVEHPMQKWQGSKAWNSINGKPYWKVSSNRFPIFLSIHMVLGLPPTNFMNFGLIINLWKFMQGLTSHKRKIYNYNSTHALVLKFLPEFIYDKNSLPQKFHNFWSTGTLDIK